MVSGDQNARTFTCKEILHARGKFAKVSLNFPQNRSKRSGSLVGRRIAEVECELIIETLADQRGSRTNAAKLLGISIRTLRNKIHEYDGRGKTVPKPGRPLNNVRFGSLA